MLCQTVVHLDRQAEQVRHARHGVIEAVEGRFRRLVLRPWPKLVSLADVFLFGPWFHRRSRRDRCLLYFDQPWGSPNYLAVKYLLTYGGTSYASVVAARNAIDEVARIKGSDALVCHVSNRRLSARIMTRWGWQPLNDSPRCSLFVRRFYGQYPPKAVAAPALMTTGASRG